MKIFLIILFIILGLILFAFVLSFILYRIIYKSMFLVHFQNKENPTSYLKEEEYTLKEKNNLLKAYYYHNERASHLIVFSHGLMSEHRNYYPIYEKLYENGYSVFTYDGHGSYKSSGKGIESLIQSVRDIECVLDFINNNLPYKKITLIGHSLGAYAIIKADKIYKKNVQKIISVSGFSSRKKIIENTSLNHTPLILKMMILPFLLHKENKFEKFNDDEILISLKANENIKHFILHSKDDHIVPYKVSIAHLLDDNSLNNVKVKLYENRGHNGILYSDECNLYRKKCHHQFYEMQKKGIVKSFGDYKTKYVSILEYEVMDKELLKTLKEFIDE